MKIFLLFLTLNLLSYQAKVVFIDNNFKNLKENNIKKVIYLSSEIAFDIKKGKISNLYRNIEQDIIENSGEYNDINKESNKKDSINKKKVCVIVLKITSVVDTLIKAVELKHCKNKKNEILGEFQKSKIGDFIEIETVFDKKNKEKFSQNRLAEAFASIYMLGIDNDFNYLLESGINEINKKADKKDEGLSNLDKPKNSNGVKTKKLPRKKEKRKKKRRKKKKRNFENIRL